MTIAEQFRDAGYATFFAGKWHLGVGEYSPNAQGFGPGLTGSGQFYYPPSDVPPPDLRDDPKTTDRIANEAVRFIEAHQDAPFFAYLPFLAVHTPIKAAPDAGREIRSQAEVRAGRRLGPGARAKGPPRAKPCGLRRNA